jgi:predicted dehydrogenase
MSEHRLRWGVLGVAGIAVRKVIPAMQKSELTEITAIASRDPEKARAAAQELGIPKSYGSYEALLADPEIDCIYNPLPNHMHVPWSIRAAEAGKHVLCEKPIALSAAECLELIAVRDRTGVKIGEAFMIRSHPQWRRARKILRAGAIGDLRAFMGVFSYNNRDPKNIRNIPEWGGGGLMDIGCYPIQASRFLFGAEPLRALSLIDRDPAMRTDRLSSGILDFPAGQAVFTCSTQLVPFQKVQILGTGGRIELEIPFNAPPDRPSRLTIDSGKDLIGGGAVTETFAPCDQYTLQGDEFSRAVLGQGEVPTPLEDSLANMKVIDALFRSERENGWAVV